MKPKGRIPNEVKYFLKANPDLPHCLLICDCGRWFSKVDYLAPYHFERCYCNKCGYMGDQESKVGEFFSKIPDELYF